MSNQTVSGVHRGVPSFFRACCSRAAEGGTNSYAAAAWHLASSIGSSQAPCDVEPDHWETEVLALKERLAEGNKQGVWSWFTDHYPKCMELVPARRREQFVAGVERAHEDGRMEL
jgi:hypothetical protein